VDEHRSATLPSSRFAAPRLSSALIRSRLARIARTILAPNRAQRQLPTRSKRPRWRPAKLPNVRFGSLADIRRRIRDVRFIAKSRHAHRRHQCLLSATSGLSPRNQPRQRHGLFVVRQREANYRDHASSLQLRSAMVEGKRCASQASFDHMPFSDQGTGCLSPIILRARLTYQLSDFDQPFQLSVYLTKLICGIFGS
jgi:hypothetical protein